MRYIRRVEVAEPGTRNEHITRVHYSVTTTGRLFAASRREVADEIHDRLESYRTHNDRTGDEAEVVTRLSWSGLRYLTTVADGRETNNLLELPRI